MRRRLIPPVTNMHVQMDDGSTVVLDTEGSILENLDFIAGGYTQHCANCTASSLVYLSLDINTAQAVYTCCCCGHTGECPVMVV